MAVSVDKVYKTVLLIMNKEQRGSATPDEMAKVGTLVQREIFEGYVEDLNQLVRVPQTDTDYADRVANIDEKLAEFKRFDSATYDNATTPLTPYFTLPANLYRLGVAHYTGNNSMIKELQRLQRGEFYNIQRSKLTASTKQFPTCLYENDKLYVSPSSIQSSVGVDYLKKPDDVRWGYSKGSLGQFINDPTVYGADLINTGVGTLTSSLTTLTDGIPGTYTAPVITTSGSGTGLVLSVDVTATTNASVTVTTAGTGYEVGDTVNFAGGVISTSPAVITLQSSDFNANSTYGTTNFELHTSEQTDIILRVLMYFGIIIRDPQIIQGATQQIQQDEINEKR